MTMIYIEHWSPEEVAGWIRHIGLSDCADSFLEKGVTGLDLLEITESMLASGRLQMGWACKGDVQASECYDLRQTDQAPCTPIS
ncbi:unnamed protein product [Boreogadus saida]